MRTGALSAAGRRDSYRAVGLLDDSVLDRELETHARLTPDAPYLVDRTGSHSFGEIESKARRLAGALRGMGVGKGDVVSFQLPNWEEAAVTFFATVSLGAISNPIVPIYREREVRFILQQARPKAVVIPHAFRNVSYPELYQRVAGDVPQTHLVVVGPEGDLPGSNAHSYEECISHEEALPERHRHGRDPSVLLYTSGTTADPKGVLHSHDSLRYECRSIIDQCGLVRADVIFMASPVTHVTGLLYGIELPAMIGAKSVLEDIWDPARACEVVDRYGCTFTVGATPFLHGLVRAGTEERPGTLGTLRCFVCGGADIPPELVLRAKQDLDLDVVRAYGLSELPTATCGGIQDRLDRRSASDGRPLPTGRVRVRHEDGAVAEEGLGELEAIAPELFLGYLDPALDEAAFTEDGWFRTGDLAFIDIDGYVTIRGRLKDVIVRGGENISAKEIEDLLYEHPKVREVAVVGVPDEVMGQRACAFVVAGGQIPSLTELVDFLKEKGIARQKIPERLEIIDELPMTASGKVQKHRLRDRAARSSNGA